MIGTNVGNYRVVSRLGEGGAGIVYLAEHPEIGRRVAMKVLRRSVVDDDGLYGRFLAEARAANAIKHPNIVEVFDFGRLSDGSPYFLMEHLEGENLADRLSRTGRLKVASAVEYAFQILDALIAAHAKQIVHRDLKPDNVFLTADPNVAGREVIKILDFGTSERTYTRLA